MKNVFSSRKIRAVIIILGTGAVLCLVFGAGIAVGYRKAIFSSLYGENYYRDFSGMPEGALDPATRTAHLMNMHGTVGVVIDVATGTITVRNPDDDEEFVAVLPDTMIRILNQSILLGDVGIGDHVTVIGQPNDIGEIQARFIRVFRVSSSTPAPEAPLGIPMMMRN
jgi:hypothetical protein